MAAVKKKDGNPDFEMMEADCPGCKKSTDAAEVFKNNDEVLRKKAAEVLRMRRELGMEGLVGDLRYIVINTEPQNLKASVQEMLGVTGFEFEQAYETEDSITCELTANKGSDLLMTSRKAPSPFRPFNINPKSKHLPDTRLETFVFEVKDMSHYVEAQQRRGVRFLTNAPISSKTHSFIQTAPSQLTGNSIGVVEFKDGVKDIIPAGAKKLEWTFEKPKKDHLKNILEIDHVATRVRSQDRDTAILEFMGLTDHKFDFAIYVEAFNSITNVARMTKGAFAMVFTSGISPYQDDKSSGPTEKFVHNYGPRTHHIAFNTEHIEDTFESLKSDGMGFLLPLVGSPDEGLKQTFSRPSENTLLVNEYLHRYNDFDGFFTKSNVTLLTGSTDQQ